jgi:hypothetical protein
MKWFSNKPSEPAAPTDAQVIRSKLAENKAQIEAAQADLQRVSLASVLGSDDAAGREAIKHLTELRSRADLLAAALRAAHEEEERERGRLSAKDFATKQRSLAQHSGAIRRQALELTSALSAARDAFRKVLATGAQIGALLPMSLRNSYTELTEESFLRDLADIEALRLSNQDSPGALGVGVIERPRRIGQYEADDGFTLSTLAENLNALLANLKESFDRCAAVAPVKQQIPSTGPSPVCERDGDLGEVAAPLPPQVAVDAPQESTGELVDLRSHSETAELEVTA